MFIATVIGVIVLGGALAYGLYQYNTRSRRLDPVRDAATRQTYEENGPPGGGGSPPR